MAALAWPLMRNNLQKTDLEALVRILRTRDPILTQSAQVRGFEADWSDWLGVRKSVFVNSGSSANLISMAALRHMKGGGEVIVPSLTWVSDIGSVLHNQFKPVFVDINPRTLGMDPEQILSKLGRKTRAVFLTHVLGFNALTTELLSALKTRHLPLIEDCCESHGATHEGRKVGTFGWMSDFSFYYAHHLTTVEGGMVSTDDEDLYQVLRMLRSHGMVREADSPSLRRRWEKRHPDLNPSFIFAYPGYNVRSTELNAILGRSQLKRLDANNEARRRNLDLFLEGLDGGRYYTDFDTQGSCNYALTLILRRADDRLRDGVMKALAGAGVEFRRGTAGGGSQLRQPYLRAYGVKARPRDFPRVDHVHFYGFYIGNYPGLKADRIAKLCALLNRVPQGKGAKAVEGFDG